MEGLSLSNLFVDITNKRQQETSRQMSQITGAIDQIAGHKKQQRLATERDELLKDNREYQEKKEFRRTEDTIYKNYGKYFTEDDQKIEGMKTQYGIGTDQEDRSGYYRDLDVYGQGFVTKEKEDKLATETKLKQTQRKNKLEQQTGKEVEFDEGVGDFVIFDDVSGEFIDADQYVGLKRDRATKEKTGKPSAERIKLEAWFKEEGITPTNTGILNMQEQRNRIVTLKSDIEKFDKDPNIKRLMSDTKKIDNALYREKSREFILKNAGVKKRGIKGWLTDDEKERDTNIDTAISESGGEFKKEDGKYYERVRVGDVAADNNIKEAAAQKLLDRVLIQDDKVKELEAMTDGDGTNRKEALINKFMELNKIETREEAVKILSEAGRI